MASVTPLVATASTSNTSSYASGTFTPSTGDLLVVFVHASGTVAKGALIGSINSGFQLVATVLDATSANTLYCFVALSPAKNTANQTVTFTCLDDSATGAIIHVYGVSGMSRVGMQAVLQTANQANHASGTPAPAFGASAQTGNVTLGAIANSTSPAGMTAPTGWTESTTPAMDSGYSTPTTGMESVYRNSGFTGTTITWGSSSASAFASLIIELDTSANPGGGNVQQIAGNNTSTTDLVLTPNQAITNGNLVIVAINDNNNPQVVTGVTDSHGNTYTKITGASGQTGGTHNATGALYYSYNIAGAPTTVTIQKGGGTAAVEAIVREYTGFTTTDPLDKTAYTGGSGTSAASGSTATLSQASELVIGYEADDAGSSQVMSIASPNGDLDSVVAAAGSVAMQDKVVNATTAVSSTITLFSSTDNAAGVATFKINSTVTTTQTIQGKSRITAQTNQTQLGKARITATTLQTQTGKSRITITTLQTIAGKSRITATTLKTQPGKANIKNNTLQTQLGKSRIQITTLQTIAGKSRITIVTLKTQPGKSRITATTSQTQPGKARITATTVQTQAGKSRITQTVLKTLQGLSRITAQATKTIQGLARITATTTKTQQGKSRITASASQTQLGKARITASTLQTILGKARITATTLKTIAGLARIQITSTKTQTGKSRITIQTLQTQAGKSRITAKSTQTQTGKSRITATTTQTVPGKSRIQITTLRTITGVANIHSATTTTDQTITGKSRIQITSQQAQTGRARVTITTKQTQSGKSRVQITTLQTTQGRSRITATATQTIAGKARLENVVDKTITGHSRIMVVTSQTVLGRARISAQATRIITGVSRLAVLRQQTIDGQSFILLIQNRTITGKARIHAPWYRRNPKPYSEAADNSWELINRKSFSDALNREWYNRKQNNWSVNN